VLFFFVSAGVTSLLYTTGEQCVCKIRNGT
jgi:hypothetical protein